MKILIIEDEFPAAKQLQKLILRYKPKANILNVIDSVEMAVNWFNTNASPDLIFMDIQLADGLSFDIFNHTKVMAPVIFTTAFDQYTLKAFKVNSVDYLLKPIEPNELQAAILKFEQQFAQDSAVDQVLLQHLMQSINKPIYKERFLLKIGQQLSFVPTTDIAYFFSTDGIVYIKTQEGKKHLLDQTLDQLNQELNPAFFFRINRKTIISIHAILKIHPYFNSRLILEVSPKPDFDLIVSRDRVGDFKNWLDGQTS
ncbi:MAG: LytTR family DNA-binding domain-containing protein [Saprospiraceae bacterium]